MTAPSGDTWFVPRVNTAGRRKGIAPVTRAGVLSFVGFVAGEMISLLAGFAVIFTMPDMLVLGIAIIVVGVGLSMAFLFLMIKRHTDFSMTYDAYKARQARNG